MPIPLVSTPSLSSANILISPLRLSNSRSKVSCSGCYSNDLSSRTRRVSIRLRQPLQAISLRVIWSGGYLGSLRWVFRSWLISWIKSCTLSRLEWMELVYFIDWKVLPKEWLGGGGYRFFVGCCCADPGFA